MLPCRRMVCVELQVGNERVNTCWLGKHCMFKYLTQRERLPRRNPADGCSRILWNLVICGGEQTGGYSKTPADLSRRCRQTHPCETLISPRGTLPLSDLFRKALPPDVRQLSVPRRHSLTNQKGKLSSVFRVSSQSF